MRFAIDAFLDTKREKGREPATISSAEDRLWRLLGLPGNGARPLRFVHGKGAELYAAARVDVAADTHRNALSVGKDWGAFCVSRRWLRLNPFADVEPVGRKVTGAEKPQLRIDEVRKLQAWCHAHAGEQGAIVTLGYLLLGARASELVRRPIRDLDDDGRVLWIGKTKSRAGRRRLKIPAELQPLLANLAAGRASEAPLFVGEDGEARDRFWARLQVLRACRLAEVPELPPQALRATQATLATDAGATGLMVAEHLGHGSVGVAARSYVQPDAARAAQADRAFRVIAGGKR